MTGGPDGPGGPDGLYAPFRPVRGRRVAQVIGVVAVLWGIGLSALVWGLTPGDRASFIGTGLLVAVFCVMQARVVAVPDRDGLFVRNLVNRRRLAWAEVVGVSFGGGRPWVQLDLADGDVLAVMGVQRADGARGDAEARRLATLVALHGQGPDASGAAGGRRVP